ncbi:MAG: 5-formyltetrahydrofolate cyclo-ligase [Rhodospirillales bacterium]
MSIDRDKAAWRERLKDIRRGLGPERRARAGAAVCERAEMLIRKNMSLPTDAAVSGFWPIGEEIDIRPILERLHGAGYVCALPVVPGKRMRLIFRRWVPGTALVSAGFGLSQPDGDAPETTPRAVLMPLLGFDQEGYRLGWGGGYFDRTLAFLRAQGDVSAIGVGFAAQRVDTLPHDGHDQRLDFMVTEEGVIAF